jgi:predicted DsbA family dithiol-disulfide isomerase
MRVDFVSDINCPWCALGLAELKQALAQLGNTIDVELHFQPFELNPQLPPGGKNLAAYLHEKYGMDSARIDAVHQQLQERGSAVGFTFAKREFLWNSFKAHQLLCWAEQELGLTAQRLLKSGLMQAYHGEAKNIADEQVLLALIDQLGLPRERASEVLASGEYSQVVRALEQQWHAAGINAVPSIIIDRKHLVQGAQPAENLVNVFNQLAQETASAKIPSGMR